VRGGSFEVEVLEEARRRRDRKFLLPSVIIALLFSVARSVCPPRPPRSSLFLVRTDTGDQATSVGAEREKKKRGRGGHQRRKALALKPFIASLERNKKKRRRLGERGNGARQKKKKRSLIRRARRCFFLPLRSLRAAFRRDPHAFVEKEQDGERGAVSLRALFSASLSLRSA